MLERLREEHKALLAMLPRAERLLKPDTKSDFAPIAVARQAFASTLQEHVRFKNAFVYRILLTSRRRVDIAIARTISAKGQALVDAHAAHIGRWGAPEMASNWQRYCETSLELIAAIRNHIFEEQRQVYPLLLGTPNMLPANETRSDTEHSATGH